MCRLTRAGWLDHADDDDVGDIAAIYPAIAYIMNAFVVGETTTHLKSLAEFKTMTPENRLICRIAAISAEIAKFLLLSL